MKISTHRSGAWKSYVNERRDLLTKIIMRIQLLFVIMLITAMHTFGNAAAQSVSLSARKAPLSKILDQIEQQTGYYFAYKVQTVEDLLVTVELKNVPLQEALEACFKNLPVNYKISERTIVISRKPQQNGQAPEVVVVPPVKITGKVTTKDGSPFPSVTVRIKGQKQVAVTNNDGYYEIQGEISDVIVFSYIGHETVELRLGGQKEIDIVLLEAAAQLKETVVKGYYSVPRELNTGSVSGIKAIDISRQPVSDPLMALQSKVPGLYIAQTSGVPGAALTVRLRGQNSIDNGNDPLYIVDGVPFNSESIGLNSNAASGNLSPLASIRPSDIESIEVLKDADATAIYGSRGANGVILISTKKGKSGKIKLDFNIYQGAGSITRRLDLLNTPEYLEMRNEAFKNDNATPGMADYDVNGTWDQSRFTDWQDVLIGGTAHFTNAHAAISGGSAATQFLISGDYRNETTVYPGDYRNRIGSALFNLSHTTEDKKFRVDMSTTFSSNNNRLPQSDFTSNIFLAPNAPAIYNAEGTLNWENSTFNNPLGNSRIRSTSKTDNLNSNLILSYSFLRDFQFKTSFGYNTQLINEVNIVPFAAGNPARANADLIRTNITAANRVKAWIAEPQLNFNRKFGHHNLDALFGATWQVRNQEGQRQTYSGFLNDELIANPAAAATKGALVTNYSIYHYSALYARVGYNYKERYILNLTGRRDGSSRFGPENTFGNFGALGAAWIISKEEFFQKKLSFISLLKLRGSVGKTGNDQLPNYAYLSTYESNSLSYNGVPVLVPKGLTNPFYGWETINQIETALEMGLLKNRILLNTTWFRKRSSNQLVKYPLPVVAGFSDIFANLPAVTQNSGLEFDLSSVNITNNEWSWTTALNLSVPWSKLVEFPDIEKTAYKNRYVVGEPLYLRFVYKYTGIDPTSGLYTFEDVNKDGSITSTQDKVPVFTGQHWYGAINNNLSYKGVSIDFSIQFVKQTGFGFLINQSPGLVNFNQPTEVLDRWQQEGDISKFQRFTRNTTTAFTANSLFLESDIRYTDASFVRFRNLSVSYSLSPKWMNYFRLSSARIYCQGQNLFTITNFKGLDPETQRSGFAPSLPPLRVLTAGIQLTF
ncbi:SusC/RagA family TonB-linked outer membrane protein [Chitinophaga sedimenti]|uniref:SusC/RagA family TonB-linked outer membrane protein n=1 Tax=Chitinophaga sedimenti TaxID=2033606 RepID=UPI002002F7A0|nr:SusC/RagA family TonB-linked outer membrane protein [Chitinophaga sedimenti]MCK7553741.1 SusC/RagA family TonB-linked outer membrane protein [Chitinophaga sedimenti]